jgi:hypothetical protein
MRFFRELPTINENVWADLEGDIFDVVKALDMSQPATVTRKGLFNTWVKRYPISKQLKMIKARKEPEVYKQFKSSICVKYEITLGDKYKPRVFFPKTDTNLAFNGPLMYFVKRKFSKIFDGQQTPFIFGSGHTNYSLGVAFQQALPGDADISVELDLSMCETTMRGPFLLIEKEVYTRFGLSQNECDYLLNHTRSYGHTSKRDLHFSMPFCRESGTANTTVGNTIVFGVCLWAALKHVGLPQKEWLCLLGGDDACIYTNHRWLPIIKQAIELVSQLGLKPEPLYCDNIFSGRFYGGRMVPYEVNGEYTFIHTPLIGRALCKNNCMRYVKGQRVLPWLRDVCLARKYEWGHVPILRGVFEAMLPQFQNVKGKETSTDYWERMIRISQIDIFPREYTYRALGLSYKLDVQQLYDLETYLREHFSSNWVGKTIENDILEEICVVDLK